MIKEQWVTLLLIVAIIASTSGKSLLTTTTSGKALLTTTTSGKALLTTTTSGKALLTTTTLGKALLTKTTSGKALLTMTTSGKALLTKTTSDKALLTTTTSGKALLTKTTSGKALLTKTTSGKALLTKTTSGQILLTKTTSGKALLTKTTSGKALLTKATCLAMPPCICHTHDVICSKQNLMNIPDFATVDTQFDNISILFDSNQITFVQANAFINVSSVNASTVAIDLSSNNIDTIENGAFNGIENEIDMINLSQNNLSVIPAAIGQLSNLKNLNVQFNPITALDSSVMFKLGQSLNTFYISLDHFNSWPTELHLLRYLSKLNIDRIKLMSLDENVFHGFETSLKILSLTNSSLERIPYAVCNLQKLRVLNFNDNIHLKVPILESCKLPSVLKLNLDNTNLNYFPNVFNEFPSLNTLLLSHNAIDYIKEEIAPKESNLTTLDLSYNQLYRIPFVVNNFRNLEYLNLSDNSIISVEDRDLIGSYVISNLNLANNPITYIAKSAFGRTQYLSYLGLSQTRLRMVPEAVTTVRSLQKFDFAMNNVECSCSLDYLKTWNVSNVTISGNCEAGQEGIKEFLISSLPMCL